MWVGKRGVRERRQERCDKREEEKRHGGEKRRKEMSSVLFRCSTVSTLESEFS